MVTWFAADICVSRSLALSDGLCGMSCNTLRTLQWMAVCRLICAISKIDELVFLKWHVIFHAITLSTSSCTSSVSSAMSILPFNFLLSAKLPVLQFLTTSWRSLMEIINRIGPSTEPWGTPLTTGFGSGCWPSITTVWCLFERNDTMI